MAAAGTVTLLFTDLVDSTPMLEELGDAGNEPLRRAHARLLRSEVEAHDGRPVKDTGDGVMAAFGAPSDAVRCAIAVQQAIEMHNRTPGSRRLGVRIGIHVGEVTEDGGDYFGTVVVVAERLCRKAAAGEIVTSDLVRAITSGRSDIEFEDLGALELKGFSTPVPAARVVFDEVPVALGIQSDRGAAFVGRQRELTLLDEVWELARAGQRALVLISGEPGIGKTRLALTHAERNGDAGAIVLVGRCEENAPLPFLPFTEALVPHADLPDVAVGTVAAAVLGSEDVDRYRLFDAVATTLRDLARQAPVVLVLDDLHWADEGTLSLLRYIVRRPDSARLLVVGTYRDTDLTRSHALTSVLGDLVRDGAVQIDLQGLDAGSVAAMLGDAVPAEAAKAIFNETEGNPFFVLEVARHVAETGATTQIPKGVRDVLGRRLSRLSDASVEVLRAAAVIGREFDLGLLSAVAEIDDEDALRAVEDARQAKLVDEVDGVLDRWRFAHALVHETLLDELTTSRRVRMHERVVGALERLCGTASGPHMVMLAHHSSEAAAAGNTVRAATYALLAAQHVLKRFGYEEAARLCTRGLEALDMGADDRALRCQLLLVRGDAYEWIGDRRADSDLDAATSMSRVLEDHPRLYAEAMVRSFALFPGQYDAPLVRQLREALARLPDDEIDLRATLHGMLAAATAFGEPRETARAHARQALELAGRARDTELAGLAIYFASFPSTMAGETRYADQILDLIRGGGGPLEMPARSMRIVALCARCDLIGARDEMGRLREVVAEVPAAMGRYAVLVLEATFATIEGRFREASRFGREAGVVAGDMLRSIYGDLATLTPAMAAMPRLRWQGRSAELVPYTEAAAGSLPGVGWHAALAAVLADVGRLDDALEVLEELAKDRFRGLAREAMASSVDRYSVALAIEAATAVGHKGWLRELYDLLVSEAALAALITYGPAPVQWLGSCHLYLGVAARALGETVTAESHLRSALDIHEREGARPLAARACHELALSLRDRASPTARSEASAHARVARAAADDLGLVVLRRQLDGAGL